MDLFKRAEPLIGSDLPAKYVAVVDVEASELPSIDWANIKLFTSFVDLVSDDGDAINIYVVRDTAEHLAMVRLVADNAALCGVQIHHVVGLTDYAESSSASQAFWNCPLIQFQDWVNEAQEAAREAELARRSEMDRDENKKLDAQRDNGTYKRVVVTEVPDEPDDMQLVM